MKPEYTLNTSNDKRLNDTKKETTTIKTRDSSSREILKYVFTELNIQTTKVFESKLRNLVEQFDFEIVKYAFEYARLKGNNPKQYLITVLETWLNNDIKTLQQSKVFKCNNKKELISMEITPDWLKKSTSKRYCIKNHIKFGEVNSDNSTFERDKKLMQRLKEKWE